MAPAAPNMRPEWIAGTDAKDWFDASDVGLRLLRAQGSIRRQPGCQPIYSVRTLEKLTGRKPTITHLGAAGAIDYTRRFDRDDVDTATLAVWRNNGSLPFESLGLKNFLHDVARLRALCEAPIVDASGVTIR